MSARHVADLLTLSHVGWTEAAASNDPDLKARSLELAAHALSHPDAPTFFAGFQVALAETHEPRSETDAEPTQRDIRTGGANGASPIDAGALPHDGVVNEADRRHADDLESKPRRKPHGDPAHACDNIARALKNLRRRH